MKKITPCIWFDSEAEEVANFYVSIFPNSKIKNVEKYVTETPSNKPIGSVITVTFELDGNEFMTLNGGSYFKVSEATSFIIPCDTQKEMDYYYEKLSAEPDSEVCGWLKDKFGVSWQVIPSDYDEMMKSASDDSKKKAMEALLKMKRLNIEKLKKALS
jgi:predicted 3-demethylubiquinone-9 3-methyltransferase (glyoxalase superfamily)